MLSYVFKREKICPRLVNWSTLQLASYTCARVALHWKYDCVQSSHYSFTVRNDCASCGIGTILIARIHQSRSQRIEMCLSFTPSLLAFIYNQQQALVQQKSYTASTMPLHEGELNPPSSPAADSLQGNGRTTTRPASKMRNRREYRGIFSSSICDMFSSSRKSKTDACALACCGIWLWERNQFLLQGKHPKGWMQRPMETIVVCLLLASAVIWTLAPHSLALQVCLLTAIVLALWRFLEFEYTRSKFRKEMAVEEYRRQNLLSANGDEMIGEPSANDPRTIPQRRLSPTSNGSNNVNYDDHENNGLQLYLSSNWNEIHRRHHIFSCVKNDTHSVEEDDEEDNLDFCQRLWQCLASLCCNTCCMCWCLCCGMFVLSHNGFVKIVDMSDHYILILNHQACVPLLKNTATWLKFYQNHQHSGNETISQCNLGVTISRASCNYGMQET